MKIIKRNKEILLFILKATMVYGGVFMILITFFLTGMGSVLFSDPSCTIDGIEYVEYIDAKESAILTSLVNGALVFFGVAFIVLSDEVTYCDSLSEARNLDRTRELRHQLEQARQNVGNFFMRHDVPDHVFRQHLQHETHIGGLDPIMAEEPPPASSEAVSADYDKWNNEN